jgi:threonine 3-dehydrogenase
MNHTHSLAAVFHQSDQPLTIDRHALPKLSAGEALVKVDCCTICGSDVHSILGHRDVPRPTILGHEIVGRVHDLAELEPPIDVRGNRLKIGDRVVWSVAANCGECDRCVAGLPQKCRHLFKYGHEATTVKNSSGIDHPLSGGLAEFCHLARGTAIVAVGDQISDSIIAPASCATATVRQAFESFAVRNGLDGNASNSPNLTGKRVLLFGAGMLGLTACAMSRSMGADVVVACDIDSAKLKRATEFGATGAVEWQSDLASLKAALCECSGGSPEFDAVLDFSGAPDAIEIAPELTDIGGHIILVGSVSTTRRVQWDPEQIVRRLITVRGIHNYTPQALESAVEFLQENQNKYPFDELVEASFSLAEINSAVETAIKTRPCRIAIRP